MELKIQSTRPLEQLEQSLTFSVREIMLSFLLFVGNTVLFEGEYIRKEHIKRVCSVKELKSKEVHVKIK